MNEGLVTGVTWRTGMAVLEAPLVGGHWWLAVPHRVGSTVTEQSEHWECEEEEKGMASTCSGR
jgi:hypothetical protein